MSIETIRPERPSGEWTGTDRLDYGGTMLRVAERDGHRFVCNGTIPVSEAGPPFVGTLAAELERHPFDVLDWAAGRPRTDPAKDAREASKRGAGCGGIRLGEGPDGENTAEPAT